MVWIALNFVLAALNFCFFVTNGKPFSLVVGVFCFLVGVYMYSVKDER